MVCRESAFNVNDYAPHLNRKYKIMQNTLVVFRAENKNKITPNNKK